jgi:hypothetical protein
MRFNFAWRVLGSIPFILLLASSCSVIYDLSADQCTSNDDCIGRFGQGYTCDVGLCITGQNDAGSSGKGGGGKGGSSGATAGTSTDGGTDDGGTAGTGGTEPNAGTAGTGPVEVECASHKECFDLYPEDSEENPRACIEGTCVPLITEECPVVMPLEDNPADGKNSAWNLLKSTNALIIGAFAPFNGNAMTTQANNFDFALTEFTDTTKGINIGNTTKKRQIVTVLCSSFYDTQDQLLTPANHLIQDLKVPAVVTAMLLQDQSYLWENAAKENGVLMMNSVYSDQALIDAADDNLVWNMLSGANALSVSYQPLLDKIEQHLRALDVLDTADDLKVAHVKATDEPFLQDTAAFIEKNLQFNGQSRAANQAADLYKPIEIQSIYANATDPRTDAINQLVAFAPHVVIGTTVSEMLQYVIPGVEAAWDAAHPGQKRPFYLLGALNYGDGPMAGLISNDQPVSGQKQLYQRILGLNWPSAADLTVFNEYQDRWQSRYGKKEYGFENYYDSMYYLLYGIAAVKLDSPTATSISGGDIAKGLLRVIQIGSSVPRVNVGPGDEMVNAVNLLANGNKTSKIELIGAMGPPNWDSGGGRNDAGSVWCVNALGNYQIDQLRYDESDSSLQPSSSAPLPNSDLACFTFPAQ